MQERCDRNHSLGLLTPEPPIC